MLSVVLGTSINKTTICELTCPGICFHGQHGFRRNESHSKHTHLKKRYAQTRKVVELKPMIQSEAVMMFENCGRTYLTF